jgi:hypothetical protein
MKPSFESFLKCLRFEPGISIQNKTRGFIAEPGDFNLIR